MPKTKTPKPAAKVYRAASCARLSVDDESYGTSGSVINQHAVIRDFADANGGLRIVAEYSDDGCSALHLREPPRLEQPARRRSSGIQVLPEALPLKTGESHAETAASASSTPENSLGKAASFASFE